MVKDINELLKNVKFLKELSTLPDRVAALEKENEELRQQINSKLIPVSKAPTGPTCEYCLTGVLRLEKEEVSAMDGHVFGTVDKTYLCDNCGKEKIKRNVRS